VKMMKRESHLVLWPWLLLCLWILTLVFVGALLYQDSRNKPITTVQPLADNQSNISTSSNSQPNNQPDACGRSYDASSEVSVVMSITATAIQIASPGVAPYSLSIAPTAAFYDSDCQPVTIGDIHVGDTVVVFSSMSVNAATTIQKTAANE
jgi:hypothetical protein